MVRSRSKSQAYRKSRQARKRAVQASARKPRGAPRRPSKRILDLLQAVEDQRIRAYQRPRLARVVRRVHVAAMGDSWFHYFPAWDILTKLRTNNDTAKAGATLNEMVYGRTYQLLQQHPEADVFRRWQ